ncbi:MAG: response regulator [Gemmatimonadota bacterium]
MTNESHAAISSNAGLVGALLESLQSAVLVEDEARRVALANPRFCRMFGLPLTPAELVGADCTEMARAAAPAFVSPEAFLARLDEILAAGVAVEGEEIRMTDGRILVRDFVPIRVGGRPTGRLWQYRDISDIRAGEALSRAIIDTALDAIITIDHRGRIVEFNAAAEQIFGHQRQDVLGKTMGDVIVPPHLREAHAAGMKRYLGSRDSRILGQRLELTAVRADGTEFPVELTVNRIPDSEPPVFTGFIRDITAAKSHEAELEAAKNTAEEASRAKSDFLATMSHEIRTPMNAILGMTELALDLAEVDDQRTLLGSVQSNADSLLNVINDVLDLSKIESGTLDISREAFSVAEVTESVVEALAVRAFEKGVEVTCAVQPELQRQVEGDPHRLRQVLVNLVGNAVKFTDAGEVEVLAQVVASDRVRFTVRDTGIGISEEHLPRVFEPFVQSRSADSRRRGGTGLGLGICRSLADLMNGTLSATSVLGLGSEFRFEVPLEWAASDGVEPPDLGGEQEILVVTPNPTLARAVMVSLGEGSSVRRTAVEELPEALQGARRDPVVLADHRLGLTALSEVARAASAHSDRSELTVLVPPGPVRPWQVDGPPTTRYVSKPLTLAKLVDTLTPWSADDEDQPSFPPVAGQVGVGVRLLMVEDNPENQAYARRVLESSGYAVDIADDGVEGARMAQDSAYDLIIADLDMPRMDGFEMTETIHGLLGDAAPPIIAFSAHVVEGYRERCMEAGMTDFLAKPARPGEILATVARALRPSRVLVADDSPEARQLAVRFLEAEGIQVIEAGNGAEAIDLVRAGGVGLIVLDMNMPELDGYDVARHIRALAGYSSLPILATTSWVGPEEERRCLDAGCSHYVPKPLRRDDFVGTVLDLLSHRPAVPRESAVLQIDPTIADLIPGYMDACRRHVATMSEHLRRRQLEPIRVIGHQLAGSGAPYGFARITEIGRSIERDAEAGGPDAVRRWIQELETYLAEVEWEISSSG